MLHFDYYDSLMRQQIGPIYSTYTTFFSLHFDWLEAPKNTGCFPRIAFDLFLFSLICYWLNWILSKRGSLYISVSKQKCSGTLGPKRLWKLWQKFTWDHKTQQAIDSLIRLYSFLHTNRPYDHEHHNLVSNMLSRIPHWNCMLLKIINSGFMKQNKI